MCESNCAGLNRFLLFHVDAVLLSYLYLGGDELQLGCQAINSSKQFVQCVFPIRWLQSLNIF